MCWGWGGGDKKNSEKQLAVEGKKGDTVNKRTNTHTKKEAIITIQNHILFTCTALANARAKEVLAIAQNNFISHCNITDHLQRGFVPN